MQGVPKASLSKMKIFGLLLWKAIAGLKWSNGILLGAFSIIGGACGVKVQTHRTRFDNATRFFSFWKLIKQPKRGNFERYVDQITQNVIALLNIWKILTRIKVIGQWKSKNRVALSNRVRCVWTFIRGAFTIYMRGAFAIIRSGSSIIRGALNIICDAFIQHYFHILSMTCIWFNDCLNLHGLQWQWHALKRFIYALCEFYIYYQIVLIY
jgi:hypothetical protein